MGHATGLDSNKAPLRSSNGPRWTSPRPALLNGFAREGESGWATDTRALLRDALDGGDGSAESLRQVFKSNGVEGQPQTLRSLVGAALAPRVTELLAQAPTAQTALGDFEARALELMSAERWLEAHDVVAGQLLESSSIAAHDHEATLAARLLEVPSLGLKAGVAKLVLPSCVHLPNGLLSSLSPVPHSSPAVRRECVSTSWRALADWRRRSRHTRLTRLCCCRAAVPC